MDETRIIEAGSPEHLAEFTVAQLRALALSKRPEHIVPGYAALFELVRRGEDLHVEYTDRPGWMTGKVVGQSEDGTQLAVLWSDNVTRVVAAADVQPAELRPE